MVRATTTIREALRYPQQYATTVISPISSILHTRGEAQLSLLPQNIVLQEENLLWKDDLKKMEGKPLLALPKGFEVNSIELAADGITISAASTQMPACCPLCASPALRVHSHYRRQVADLPCAGRQVRLLLHVRKFFCDVTTCPRKIFAERLAPFVRPCLVNGRDSRDTLEG